jgi:hypothetical protein
MHGYGDILNIILNITSIPMLEHNLQRKWNYHFETFTWQHEKELNK